MDELHQRIRDVLGAVSALRTCFGEDAPELEHLSAEERASLCVDVEKLLIQRIEAVSAFELLVRLDPQRAQAVLLRRYLSSGVSPDTKFGGFEFELTTMVDDLVELAGEAALTSLVRSRGFDPSKLDDPRVQRSFAEALSCEESEVFQWYCRQVQHS